jgi:hypothetical protein
MFAVHLDHLMAGLSSSLKIVLFFTLSQEPSGALDGIRGYNETVLRIQ